MNTSNQNITFKGEPLKVEGTSLKAGDELPNFQLVGTDMSAISQTQYRGKVLVVLSVPSVDTPVCDVELKRFNEEASSLSDAVEILAVSRDLPFAQSRWCASSDASRVRCASDYKERSFGKTYGVELPEMGLLARAVFVADENGTLVHVEYVPELSSEPDYAAALAAVQDSIQK